MSREPRDIHLPKINHTLGLKYLFCWSCAELAWHPRRQNLGPEGLVCKIFGNKELQVSPWIRCRMSEPYSLWPITTTTAVAVGQGKRGSRGKVYLLWGEWIPGRETFLARPLRVVRIFPVLGFGGWWRRSFMCLRVGSQNNEPEWCPTFSGTLKQMHSVCCSRPRGQRA